MPSLDKLLDKDHIGGTASWVALVIGAVLLVASLSFVLQHVAVVALACVCLVGVAWLGSARLRDQ